MKFMMIRSQKLNSVYNLKAPRSVALLAKHHLTHHLCILVAPFISHHLLSSQVRVDSHPTAMESQTPPLPGPARCRVRDVHQC